MIFRQLIHEDLGCASYFIGDLDAGVAAVVDPKLEIGEYLELARYLGVRIEHVLETHNHADHVSGHGRLNAATGAPIHIHRLAEPDYPHRAFDDGWELSLGRVNVRALHTPGHRPEHTAFALIDTRRGPEPWAVLSGDSLFVGDVARPDLAVDKHDGAHGIFRSLHEQLLVLPGECEVWPAHLGGSLCGGPGMDLKVSSTIAYERAHNPLLEISDEAQFVHEMISALGPQPPNLRAIVALNRGPLRSGRVEVEALTPRQVELKRAGGALLIDVRSDREYDGAHVPGAVCNPAVHAGFGTKLAWLADRDQEIVLLGRDGDDALRATRLAGSVGIGRLGGYLAGGMATWPGAGLATEPVERIDVPGLHARRDTLQILDVRERAEWDEGHIPGSVHAPYHDLAGIPDGIDPARPVAVICASGQRSAVGASLLLRHGARHVVHVTGGGVGTWQERGWPIETEARVSGEPA
jgi:hydroxyacylglutathione hydrolase